MIINLLQSSLVLSVLYLVYRLTLHRLTLHALSRAVLVLIVLCSLLLPAFRPTLPAEDGVVAEVQQAEQTLRRVLVTAPQAESTQHVQGIRADEAGATMKQTRTPLTPGNALLALYVVVAALLLARYALSLGRYALLLRRSRRVFRVGHVRVYTHSGVASPVSWGRTLVLSPDDLRGDLLTPAGPAVNSSQHRHGPLLRHELAHIRLGHTLDRLLCDVAARLWWFCPAAWLLRADLETVHEFQADAHVVRHGVERTAYSALLVQRAAHPLPLCAVQGWRSSQTKRRLRMLYALRTRPATGWRALLLLPAVYVLAVCMAAPAEVTRPVQQALSPTGAAPGDVAAPKSLPAVPEAETAVPAPIPEAPAAQPVATEPEEDAAHYVTRRLTTESIADLAHSFGLPGDTDYSSIVTIDGVADADVQYRLDGNPCDAATFARHATVHFDEAHGTLWAFGKKDRHAALQAVPRSQARQLYGTDTEVLAVYTHEAPRANPPEERIMVTNGTDLYTVYTFH